MALDACKSETMFTNFVKGASGVSVVNMMLC